MPRYCDSEILEHNWFNWIIAEAVPVLEPYRKRGVLWTKVVGRVVDPNGRLILRSRQPISDPNHPIRLHCIGIDRGIFVTTDTGEVSIIYTDDMRGSVLPTIPDDAGEFDPTDIESNGYSKEQPVDDSWEAVLADIYKMCRGIAMRFNLPSDDDRNELTNEAALQVIRKLKSGKLTYTPGRAPVFNLLTTTIYRCMFSALSRDQRRSRNARAYAEEVRAQHLRSGSGSIIPM